MATLQEVKNSIVDLHEKVSAGFIAVQTKIDELKAEVAAGGTITEAQLDEVVAAIDTAKADLLDSQEDVID